MKNHFISIAALSVILALTTGPALAREQIRIVGSGTVYPFTARVAQQLTRKGDFKAPVVEATGTGAGFKLFCKGAGLDTPDINNASRPVKDAEEALCAKHGVTNMREIAIGYVGIVLANKKGAPLFNLTKKQIFLALARRLPDSSGKLVSNPNATWRQVDPTLPDLPIIVYGPGPVHGMRDSFVESVMEKGCEKLQAFTEAFSDEKERIEHCKQIRKDGRYIEAGGDDMILMQKLMSDRRALALLHYRFYEQNASQLQASRIESIEPTLNTIKGGLYGMAHQLYMYVKTQHIGQVPGMAQFVQEMVSDNAIGEDGYLIHKGLLPLNDVKRGEMQDAAKALGKSAP